MADVMIDVYKFNDTIRIYSSAREELNSMIETLKKEINSLGNDWKGEASKGFSINHFPKIYESMEAHIKKIERLENELKTVISEFTSLDNDLKNLSS